MLIPIGVMIGSGVFLLGPLHLGSIQFLGLFLLLFGNFLFGHELCTRKYRKAFV